MNIKNKNVYDYKKDERKRVIFIAIGILALLIFFLIDILAGQKWISVKTFIGFLFGMKNIGKNEAVIISVIRLPRACMAVLSGIALGFSGAVMQTVLNNKLASPYTLGLSSAAGLGASVSIVTGISSLFTIGTYLIPLVSFVFTGGACYLIYLFGQHFNSRPDTMILGGIGLSFIFQALQSLFQYSATAEQSQNIVFWLFGSLSRSNWITVVIILVVLLVLIPYMLKFSWELTTLKLGEENAMSLGIDVKKVRYRALFVVSVVTGVAVCFIGTIGFIGLVGPHLGRLVVGEDQRYYLPASGIFGGLILSMASVVSKIIIPGAIFPIGIITSAVGAPFFLAFIFMKKKTLVGDVVD